MAAFLVQLDPVTGFTLHNGANAVVVEAEDAADARVMAGFASELDVADWAGATATAIAAPADMIGWQLRCQVLEADGASIKADDTYVGIASDALDDMAAGMVILLNANASIAAASYNSTTQVLTVAETTDALGDHLVQVGFFPPGVPTKMTGEISGVPGFVASVTDEGAGAAALAATFAADAHIVPSVPVLVKV